jgi:hypothetical protein
MMCREMAEKEQVRNELLFMVYNHVVLSSLEHITLRL